jgi:hypothetical protein
MSKAKPLSLSTRQYMCLAVIGAVDLIVLRMPDAIMAAVEVWLVPWLCFPWTLNFKKR